MQINTHTNLISWHITISAIALRIISPERGKLYGDLAALRRTAAFLQISRRARLATDTEKLFCKAQIVPYLLTILPYVYEASRYTEWRGQCSCV